MLFVILEMDRIDGAFKCIEQANNAEMSGDLAGAYSFYCEGIDQFLQSIQTLEQERSGHNANMISVIQTNLIPLFDKVCITMFGSVSFLQR